MPITMKLICAMSLFFLAACSDSSADKATAAVDQNGNCKHEVISAHNDIKHKTEMYNINKDRGYLLGAQNACNHFKNLVGDATCKAVDSKTGSEMVISASHVSGICTEVNQLLNPNPVVTAPPATQPKPESETAPVQLSDLKKGFRIVVRDEATINKMLSTGILALLENGRIVGGAEGLNKQSPFCYLEKKETSTDVRNDDSIEMSKVVPNGRKLLVLSADTKIEMGCLRFDAKTWTLSDLTLIFGEKADILVIE